LRPSWLGIYVKPLSNDDCPDIARRNASSLNEVIGRIKYSFPPATALLIAAEVHSLAALHPTALIAELKDLPSCGSCSNVRQ